MDQHRNIEDEITFDPYIDFFTDANEQVEIRIKSTRSEHRYLLTREFNTNSRKIGNFESEVVLGSNEIWLQLDFWRTDDKGEQTTDLEEKDRIKSMKRLINGLDELLNSQKLNLLSNDTKIVAWGATLTFSRFLVITLGFQYIINFNLEGENTDAYYNVINTLDNLKEKIQEVKAVLDIRK